MTQILRATAFTALLPCAAVAQSLPGLNLDPEGTTVSGLSSGAFMAVQLQVAFSETIAGSGIVAGGPYGCADGNVFRAVRVCMNAFLGEADAANSLSKMNEFATDGLIDAVSGLAGDQVYLFHGKADDTVARASMDALHQSYLALNVPASQIDYQKEINAGHGFVTERGDLTCPTTGPDFLIDCDFDQAGDILNHLYAGLVPAGDVIEPSILRFDQAQYLQGAAGMDAQAFVYVPQSCADGVLCRLHIALHGCKQSLGRIGEDYVRLTGYNRWAETNNLVILYPQAQQIPAPWWNWFGGNPNGCWDWWGYSSDDYMSRDAPQIAAIARMAEALGAPLRK